MKDAMRQQTSTGARRRYSYLANLIVALVLACSGPAGAAEPDLSRLLLPPGFAIEVITADVPNARQLALSPSGNLYVGTRRAGNVYAVTDWQNPSTLTVRTIASGLTMPSGLAWHDDHLYVGARERILRYVDIDAQVAALTGDTELEAEVITDSLPDADHHGWKYLSVGPDGALYVPVGAPCNICLSEDERYATILRMDRNSGATSIYAAGVRNSVGLAWHPTKGELWFSDNGRDRLGDDIPAEEINRVVQPGAHYGYPFVHSSAGNRPLADPEFGTKLP